MFFLLSGCYLIPQKTDINRSNCPICPTCLPQTISPNMMVDITITPLNSIQTPSAKPTLNVVQTKIPSPTKTPTPTKTINPTATRAPTQLPSPTPFPYQIQENSPVYISNFAHPEKGCHWLGVAGHIFDQAGKPIEKLVIAIKGVVGVKTIDALGLTGLHDAYGPSSYEVEIGNTPFESKSAMTIQVFDLNGNNLTNKFYFDTYADCAKNLILIDFKASK